MNEEHNISNYQGPAVLATDADLQRDKNGYTNPNLHRRVYAKQPTADSKEVHPRKYSFMRTSVYETQTVEKFTHDDDSDESETP